MEKMEFLSVSKKLIESCLKFYDGDWGKLADRLDYKERTLRRVWRGEIVMTHFIEKALLDLFSEKNGTSSINSLKEEERAATPPPNSRWLHALKSKSAKGLLDLGRMIALEPSSDDMLSRLRAVLDELDRKIPPTIENQPSQKP